jgi:electron transfer flavoprotein beta subunit
LQLVAYATNLLAPARLLSILKLVQIMNILVCISKTPDTTAKIAFTDNNTKFAEAGVQFIVNPYDEWYALVRALELKEAGLAEKVTLVNVGEADADPIIRKALAIGGDDAIRVNSKSHDSFYIASQLAAVAKEGGYDLVLTGKETIDFNGSSIGGMLSQIAGYDYISLASKIDFSGSTATAVREVEGGEETCEAGLPLVISCQKGVAEQRIPSMKGIMGARSKPLVVKEPVDAPELTSIESFQLPPAKAGVKLVSAENPEELVRLLHEEARVI